MCSLFYLHVVWLVQMTVECLYCVSFQYLFNAKQSLLESHVLVHALFYCLYRDNLRLWNLHLFYFILILCIYHVMIAVFLNCMVQICLAIVSGGKFQKENAMRCLLTKNAWWINLIVEIEEFLYYLNEVQKLCFVMY